MTATATTTAMAMAMAAPQPERTEAAVSAKHRRILIAKGGANTIMQAPLSKQYHYYYLNFVFGGDKRENATATIEIETTTNNVPE